MRGSSSGGLGLRSVGVLLLLGLLAASVGQATPQSPRPLAFSLDRDRDGLDDSLEAAVAGRFALGTPLPPNVRLVDGVLHYGVWVVFDRPVAPQDLDRLREAGLRDAELFALLPDRVHGHAPATALPPLAEMAGVGYVEWDLVMRPMLATSVPAVRARASPIYPKDVWGTFNVTGAGVAIAVLDTGVDDEHQMFGGAYQAGFDATMQNAPPAATERNPDDDDANVTSPFGIRLIGAQHGTHVAGIALGGSPDSDVAGVAPDAALVDVKVLSPAGGTTADVARGIDWVVRYNSGQTTYGAPPVPVRILSISVGGYPATGEPAAGDDSASAAINKAFDQHDILAIVAAGNCGPAAGPDPDDPLDRGDPTCPRVGDDTVSNPATAARALAVAALNDFDSVGRADDTIAGYSSRGPNGAEPKPNLAAPGTRIESARGHWIPGQANSATALLSGTSMAAPHVAGAAALLMEANPALTVAEIRALLLLTAEDRGDAGWDKDFGAGMLDAYAGATQALRLASDPRAELADEVPPLPDLRNGTGGEPPIGPAVHNLLPVAKFTFTPARATVGKIVTFQDDSSDPDGRVLERHWAFGDGSTSGETDPTHIYAHPGNFLVTLRVVDDRGGAKVAQAHIIVGERVEGKSAGAPGFDALSLLAGAVAVALLLRRGRGGAG